MKKFFCATPNYDSEMNSHRPEHIAEVVQNKYSSLIKHIKQRKDVFEWTVLAGIVVESPNNSFQCVSLGTGTRAVGEERIGLVPNGGAIADCHAEVLCRRAFCKFILDQIVQFKSDSVWIEKSNGKFKLKDTIQVHFYSSSLPCGDCQIQPMNHDLEDEIPSKRRRVLDSFVSETYIDGKADIFRTGAKPVSLDDKKLEGLDQGCNYHLRGIGRTKSGRGPPSMSMSCSDKLSKWLALGIQGFLFHMFISSLIKIIHN